MIIKRISGLFLFLSIVVLSLPVRVEELVGETEHPSHRNIDGPVVNRQVGAEQLASLSIYQSHVPVVPFNSLTKCIIPNSGEVSIPELS